MDSDNSIPLIDRLKRAFETRGVLAQFARDNQMNENTVRKWVQRNSKISHDDAIIAENWLKRYNSTGISVLRPTTEEDDQRYSEIEKALAGREQEPLVQIIFNLTHIGRADADTMKQQAETNNKLAEARLIDSRTIAQLVEMAFKNASSAFEVTKGGLPQFVQVSPDGQTDAELAAAKAQSEQQSPGGTTAGSPSGTQKQKGR